MPKPIVQIRNARIVPAFNVWTDATKHANFPEAVRLVGDLASKHPVLGEPVQAAEGVNRIITSLIVEQRLSAREVETLNTIYQLVE